jgi:hypothetical protein
MAINLLDSYSRPDEADVHQVDVAWTLQQRAVASSANRKKPLAGEKPKPSDGLEPSTPSLPWRCSTN